MVTAAKAEHFEEAARLRNQVFALERIQDSVLINESFVRHERARPEVGDLIGDQTAFRVEGYDISNLGATGKVASMVVFDEHGPVKSQYRKFTIKTVVGQSDVDCLKEVLNRRLNHPEWPLPTLFLIDGGRPQVNAVLSIVRARGVKIPVVGIAKGAERKRNDIILGEPSIEIARLAQAYQSLLIRVRDEAHRFAITFQRSKRRIKR
jgi:excinuclease ABC subunit C